MQPKKDEKETEFHFLEVLRTLSLAMESSTSPPVDITPEEPAQAEIRRIQVPLMPNSLSSQTKSLYSLQAAAPDDRFTFVVNGSLLETDIPTAVGLSPAVRDQLAADSTSRRFTLSSPLICLDDLALLIAISRSGPVGEWAARHRSLVLLCQLLENFALEELFSEPYQRFAYHSLAVLDSLLGETEHTIDSEDALLNMILAMGAEYRPLLRHIQFAFLSPIGRSRLVEVIAWPNVSETIWNGATLSIKPHPLHVSKILQTFPGIFEEFRYCTFQLLWRGTRDGFRAREFHMRCDGRGNTLTLIRDRNRNIFGGFTPVEWEAREWNGRNDIDDNRWKSDRSLKSFLFTICNPRQVPPRRFPLRADKKDYAIYCSASNGPRFGGGSNGIVIADDCHANMGSFTGDFGETYTNDSIQNPVVFFAGAKYFCVDEIEVFEIRSFQE
jgi:hypothetical protein